MSYKSKEWYNQIDLRVPKENSIIITDDIMKELNPSIEKIWNKTISYRKKFKYIDRIIISKSKFHEQ